MEIDIVHRAINNLHSVSGIVGDANQNELFIDKTGDYDGSVRLMYRSHMAELPFVVKRTLTMNHVTWLQSLNEEVMVVFEKTTNQVKEQLRESSINYLEMSGNAFLNLDKFFLYINTNKSSKLSNSKSSKAFSKTGLKVIYSLISNPNAIHFSYRDLAELSGTSIDTVGRVLRELVVDKYLVKFSDREYKIIDLERLAKDWATLFNKTLRPKLKSRSFDLRDENLKLSNLLYKDLGGIVSGELAADSMSNYLIGEKANIYLDGSFVEFALNNNMKPSKNGRITLIEKFWKSSDNYFEVSENLASPMLVYADLLNDPNPRNLETANRIFKKYVHELV